MIPCSGFIEEVQSVDADAKRIPLAPPFRRVTKNLNVGYSTLVLRPSFVRQEQKSQLNQ